MTRPAESESGSVILVVEDEIELSRLFVEALGDAGFRVVPAYSVADVDFFQSLVVAWRDETLTSLVADRFDTTASFVVDCFIPIVLGAGANREFQVQYGNGFLHVREGS